MPSVARSAFLRATTALTGVADNGDVRAADDAGDLLRRGLTVTGFNLLETFIASRLEEVAAYLNAGTIQFVDLPEALQARAIRNTLEIANSRARRMGKAVAELRPFARTVGGSLVAVDRSLELSSYAWLWRGSNMAASDYAAILSAFHVRDPWSSADAVAARLGFTSPDLETALDDLARERHKCAHEALYGVTALWLRAVPTRIIALAIAFDALISVAAIRLRNGDSAYLSNDRAITEASVGIRFVRERERGAAEMLEGRSRAVRVDPDAGALFAAAGSRCSSSDIVVRQTQSENVVEWTVPALS